MRVVDGEKLPDIKMRSGMTGRWLVDSAQGAASVSVLRNWIEAGIAAPRHRHDQEEIILVEQGEIWVEVEGERVEAAAGRTVIIPARAVHAWGTPADKTARLLFIWPTADPFAPGNSTYLDGEPPTVG
jgi:quercetin dioxygenase-like cupin family protein